MKKSLSIFLALTLTLGAVVFCVPTSAQALSSNPVIASIEPKSNGKVEVEFIGKVSYNNIKVTAKDSEGKTHKTSILEFDGDEIDFRIIGAKNGKTYHFTISGIKQRGASNYTSVSGKVKFPSTKKVTIQNIEYDRGDGELSVEFAHRVHYKNTKVTIKDSAGKSYSVWIDERDSDEIDMQVSGLKAGKTYTLKISGIKHRSAKSYRSVTKNFIA